MPSTSEIDNSLRLRVALAILLQATTTQSLEFDYENDIPTYIEYGLNVAFANHSYPLALSKEHKYGDIDHRQAARVICNKALVTLNDSIRKEYLKYKFNRLSESVLAKINLRECRIFERDGNDKTIPALDLNERSLDLLSEYFKNQIEPPIKRVVKRSKKYFGLLDDALQNKTTLLADVIEEFFVFWRMALTRLSYHRPTIMRTRFPDQSSVEEIRKYIKDMHGMNTLELATHIAIEKVTKWLNLNNSVLPMLHRMLSMKRLSSNIHKKGKEKEHIELKAYIERHNDFSYNDTINVSRKAEQLLNSEFVDLQSTYFDPIYIDSIERELYELNESSCFSDTMAAFNDKLESFATENCGFKKGSFSFSKSYYKVLKIVFPLITNPFGLVEKMV